MHGFQSSRLFWRQISALRTILYYMIVEGLLVESHDASETTSRSQFTLRFSPMLLLGF